MSKEDFREIATFEDPDKVLALSVTKKIGSDGRPRLTFAVLRNLVTDNGIGRTHWLHKRHIAPLRKLLDEVEEYLSSEEEKGRIAAARR